MVKKHNKSKMSRKRLPKNIKELKDPKTLKVGHITKLSGNKYVVVRKGKNGKKYFKASKNEVKCDKDLKKNIYNMIKEVKSKKKSRAKSYPQALAIAYSKTKKHNPKCELINQDGGLFGFFESDETIKKKIFKKLIEKNYILGNNCIPIKGDKMSDLLNSYKDREDGDTTIQAIQNIKNKQYKADINAYLSIINNQLQRCSNNQQSINEEITTTYFKLSIQKNEKNRNVNIEIKQITTNNTNDNKENKTNYFKELLKFVQNLPSIDSSQLNVQENKTNIR